MESFQENRNFLNELQEINQIAFEWSKARNYSYREAFKVENWVKNRYDDVLPYDQTRVVLKDSQSGNYINASLINQVDHLPENFIASQAPLQNTVNDFWSMIWQHDVKIIVMLTRLRDGHEEKSALYWPKEISSESVFGNVTVQLSQECPRGNVATERTFVVTKTIDDSFVTRIVKQLHFTSWPDYGIPDLFSFNELIQHFQDIREKHRKNDISSHILIHCCSGIGRTGTFLTILKVIEQIQLKEKEKENLSGDVSMTNSIALRSNFNSIDVKNVILKLRENRAHLVETDKQLKFIYEFIQLYQTNIGKAASE